MEYLEGWELVPGVDDDKLSSSKHGAAESPPHSPRLDTQIPTPEKDDKEDPAQTILIAEAIEEQAEVKDPVSLMKETEFVDMKSVVPKSKSFDDDEEEDGDQVTKEDSREMKDGSCGGGFDVWKWGWGLTGIGALMFVLVLGAAGGGGGGTGITIQTKNHHMGGGFKGYEDNQRFKEMVSAVRGGGGSVPLTSAHITFGGYYDSPSLNH